MYGHIGAVVGHIDGTAWAQESDQREREHIPL